MSVSPDQESSLRLSANNINNTIQQLEKNYEISKIEVTTSIDEDNILMYLIDKLGYVYEDVSDDESV